jgi:hypothetical protein
METLMTRFWITVIGSLIALIASPFMLAALWCAAWTA